MIETEKSKSEDREFALSAVQNKLEELYKEIQSLEAELEISHQTFLEKDEENKMLKQTNQEHMQ